MPELDVLQTSFLGAAELTASPLVLGGVERRQGTLVSLVSHRLWHSDLGFALLLKLPGYF